MQKIWTVFVTSLMLVIAPQVHAATTLSGSVTYTDTGSNGANAPDYIAGIGFQALNTVEFYFVFDDPLIAPSMGSAEYFSSNYYVKFNGVDVISSALSGSSGGIIFANGLANDGFEIRATRIGDLLPGTLGDEKFSFVFAARTPNTTFVGQQIVDTSFLNNLVSPYASTFFLGSEPLVQSGGSAGASGIQQSNISISAVPEPSTWAMMIFGFGLVGAMMRGRRNRKVFA